MRFPYWHSKNSVIQIFLLRMGEKKVLICSFLLLSWKIWAGCGKKSRLVPLILCITAFNYQWSAFVLKFSLYFLFVLRTVCLFAVAGHRPSWAGLLSSWLHGSQSDTYLQNNAIDQDVTWALAAFSHYVPLKKKETWQEVWAGSFYWRHEEMNAHWRYCYKTALDIAIAWLASQMLYIYLCNFRF